jgi:hypothetical protein
MLFWRVQLISVVLCLPTEQSACNSNDSTIAPLLEKIEQMASRISAMEAKIRTMEGLCKPALSKLPENPLQAGVDIDSNHIIPDGTFSKLSIDVSIFCGRYSYSQLQCDQLNGQIVRLQPNTPGHSTTLTLTTVINDRRVFVPITASQTAGGLIEYIIALYDTDEL